MLAKTFRENSYAPLRPPQRPSLWRDTRICSNLCPMPFWVASGWHLGGTWAAVSKVTLCSVLHACG